MTDASLALNMLNVVLLSDAELEPLNFQFLETETIFTPVFVW